MSPAELERTARALRAGSIPAGVVELRRNRVRVNARVDELFLKVFLEKARSANREARALARARARGIDVPELVASGPGWTATRWLESRAAHRDDLPALLNAVRAAHARGLFHGDLHLGNLRVAGARVVLLDLQRSRFFPRVPTFLRRRDLGFLAYSLGEPLPPELAEARLFRDWRAQRHWRSRTKRCLFESGSFSALALAGERGFRRRDTDPDSLARLLAGLEHGELLKAGRNGRLVRLDERIAKQFASEREARRAWRGANGLDARGIPCARALAWLGQTLVMEDAGPTLIDWLESADPTARGKAEAELARALGSLIATLHRRGVYHADLKANNIVWRPGADARLLDYGRVAFGWRVSRRRRVKNLAQLNAALPDSISNRAREAALERYLAESGYADQRARLRADVISESLLRKHRWSGC